MQNNIIKTIFITHTYFHYYFLSSINSENMESPVLFLTSSDEVYDRINTIGFKGTPCYVEKFDANVGIKQTFINNPLNTIKSIRKDIKELKSQVDQIIAKYDLKRHSKIKIFVANEKDFFTQILIRSVNKSYIFGYEDGAGSYLKSESYNIVLKLLYPIFFFIISGTIIQYYDVYGSASFYKTFYLRYPNYKKTSTPKEKVTLGLSKGKLYSKNKHVLMFTSPFFEFQILELADELKAYNIVINTFLKNGFTVFIKEHPSEKGNKISNQTKVHFLNKNEVGEFIDYFNYEFIVNFSSSIIFDVIDSDYPLDKILTIIEINNNKVNNLFNTTTNIKYRDLSCDEVEKFILK